MTDEKKDISSDAVETTSTTTATYDAVTCRTLDAALAALDMALGIKVPRLYEGRRLVVTIEQSKP